MGRKKLEDVISHLSLEQMCTSHLDKLLVDIIRAAGETGIRKSEISRELARLTGRRIDRKKLERHIKDIYNDGKNPWGIDCVGFERESEPDAYLTGYHLDGKTSLTVEDLRFLISRVEFDRTLSAAESRRLIAKLKNVGGEPFLAVSRGFVNKEVALPRRAAEGLAVSRESIGQMRRAIDRGSRIALFECEVSEELTLVPRGEMTVFEPYKIISAAGYDYVVGVISGKRELRHYRLDRISFQAIKGERIDTFLRDNTLRAELESYLKNSTLAGERCQTYALFAIDPHRIGELVDGFGAENMRRASLPEEYEGSVGMRVRGAEGEVLAFALRHADICELVSPQRLRAELKQQAGAIAGVYSVSGEDNYDEQLSRAERVGSLWAMDVDLTKRQEHTALSNIRIARFNNNRLSDFSFLSKYKNLVTLSVIDNPVSDFTAIRGLTQLSNLYISNTNLDSLEFLRGNTSVRTLSLGNNPIDDLSLLYELYDLDYLCVDPETYERLDIDRLMEKSPALTVKAHCYFVHRARYYGLDVDERLSDKPFPLNYLYKEFGIDKKCRLDYGERDRLDICAAQLAEDPDFTEQLAGSLRDGERAVLRAFYVEGQSIRQTARALGCKICEVIKNLSAVNTALDRLFDGLRRRYLIDPENHPISDLREEMREEMRGEPRLGRRKKTSIVRTYLKGREK